LHAQVLLGVGYSLLGKQQQLYLQPLVKALLKKGYEVQDIKTVTARMCREWSCDDQMRKHLTPATLYRASNFEKYLGMCV